MYNMGYMFAILVVVVAIGLYFFQNKLLYMPRLPNVPFVVPEDNPEGFKNPGEQGIAYEDLYIQTSDNETLHAWLVKTHIGSEQAPTIVFF
jgi:hypothetical protein